MLKRWIGSILFISILGYIAYHIFHGNRSLWHYFDKIDEKEQLEEELATVKRANYKVKNKINRIAREDVDLDLLEELAMDILGFSSNKDEIVIIKK